MEPAILGGKPQFTASQPVGYPLVEKETQQRFHRLMDGVFARNFYTNDAPLLRRLEDELAARFNVAAAVAVANATAGQMLLMKAMSIESGQVIVSANTFIATAHVCEWLGAEPRFADIDPTSLCLDPEQFDQPAFDKATAIIPTHVFGVMADLPALARLATARDWKILADAAHAFDSQRDGIKPGGFGIPEFLSFHATKFFSTFEGGAILTNDAALAQALRELRNFGFAGFDNVDALGINAKMNESCAAFGLASLPALEERRAKLAAVYDKYVETLAAVPGLHVHDLKQNWTNHRYFAVFIEPDFGLDRDSVNTALWRENILARRYFFPGCHRMPYYAAKRKPPLLPHCDELLGKILCLPTSFDSVDWLKGAARTAQALAAIQENAKAIARELGSGYDYET